MEPTQVSEQFVFWLNLQFIDFHREKYIASKRISMHQISFLIYIWNYGRYTHAIGHLHIAGSVPYAEIEMGLLSIPPIQNPHMLYCVDLVTNYHKWRSFVPTNV